MPLTELALYFNNIHPAGDSALFPSGQRMEAWFREYFLGSLFEPIIELASNRIVGHQATLTVRDPDGQALSRDQAYALCRDSDEVVLLDRLCRTLHALNFLSQRQHAGGFLLLPVHPRHLLAIPCQHGLVFEALLRRCGLAAEDIVLEIGAHPLLAEERLGTAVASYRQRGYRVSIAKPAEQQQVERSFSPDFIKRKLSGLHQPVARNAPPLIVQDIATQEQLAQARSFGASYACGPLFGIAQEQCLPTHRSRAA